jgi:hypothetical protein
MTDAGSFPRALRTDSVNRGSSISLFTLESVVLTLFAGFFFFCIDGRQLEHPGVLPQIGMLPDP